MTYKFGVWKHSLGNPKEILRTCDWVNANLPRRKIQPSSRNEDPEIVFRIVDVRPGRYEQKKVDKLVENLTRLMLADPKLTQTLEPNAQLLFIGSTPSLGERATDECDKGDLRRDIKRDIEFAIRTLRSYGIALYGGIDLDLSESNRSLERLPMACSGIRLFERYYRAAPGNAANPSDTPRPPRNVTVHAKLKQIGGDLRRLLKSARELPEFEKLGKRDTKDRNRREEQELDLLREIGILFELGKGERPDSFSPRTRLKALAENHLLTLDEPDFAAHSSYALFVDTLDKLAHWVGGYRPTAAPGVWFPAGEPEAKQGIERGIALDIFKLERFNLLRDFGRVLGQGALHRLRSWDHGKQQILIIDDWLFDTLCNEQDRLSLPKRKQGDPAPEMRLVDRLKWAIAAAWSDKASVRVIRSNAIDANGEFGAKHFSSIVRLHPDAPFGPALDLDGRSFASVDALEDHVAILIDPESTRDELGAIRVHRLAKYFDQIGREPPVVAGKRRDPRRRTPPIIAFSQRESSGYVQQCLNMGASAFVVKHRPYHLLFDLARVLKDPDSFRDETPGASQFRLLRGLKPNAAAKLKRVGVPFYIHGGLERENGEIEFHELERNWVRALPKADLHYHFGTAIDLRTVAALALNTAGYFLASAREKDDDSELQRPARELLDRMAFTVGLAAQLAKLDANKHRPHVELLAAAAHGVRSDLDLKWKPFGLGDAIVEHLYEANERCDAQHATALLVAAIEVHAATNTPDAGPREMPRNGYSATLEERREDINSYLLRLGEVMSDKNAKRPVFEAHAALKLEAERTHRHYQRLGFRWAGDSSLPSMNELIKADKAKFWRALAEAVSKRIDFAWSCIGFAREPAQEKWTAAKARAVAWLAANDAQLGRLDVPNPWPPTLKTYAAVAHEEDRRGLQLYLRGADLLGSSHLQYPENLLIAAYAITRENARENIIYSEVRCETTGYAKAGMGAHDATEMLRHGFNIASLFWASERMRSQDAHPPFVADERHYPLVRTNILLAAKRHKSEPEARAVVELLDHYLERRPFDADRGWSRSEFHREFGDSIPNWWRPCEVVGFDISGNEAVKAKWLEDLVGQLASRSSPVTIHAGEAASAESIWHAVYKLNALRIGHGLRLGENLALLGHCVREGICMELCPNSNFHTNAFKPPPEDKREDVCEEGGRYDYPLRRYMRAGMEVTIGTDNRHLHPEGGRCLTSEYMMAARLAGGLTRWELLQIVKAGFKNAFLDKSEVRELVGAAEEAIYRIIASDNM